MKTSAPSLFSALLLLAPVLTGAEPQSKSPLPPALEGQPSAEIPKSLDDLKSIQEKVLKHLETSKAATVVLEGKSGSGSGVIVSPDGLILTAAHVASRPGRKFDVILADGRRVKAEALGLSEWSDAGMARLLEKGDYPYVPFESGRSCMVGEWCYALGHPSGFDEARGVVLRLGRVISLSGAQVRTDCELLPGDSGGPLFSLDGKVIAIHSAISAFRQDDNYHVDCQAFVRNWERFQDKKVFRTTPDKTKGFLGLVVDERPEGVVVMSVVRESAAASAGLKSGDVLLRIGEETIKDKETFHVLLRNRNPGEEVTLQVRRLTKAIELKAKLGAWPE